MAPSVSSQRLLNGLWPWCQDNPARGVRQKKLDDIALSFMTCYACACCSCSSGKSHAAWEEGMKRTAALIYGHSRHAAGCPGRRRDKGDARLRVGTLFCLLALVVQLALPVAQTWHITAAHAGSSARDHALSYLLRGDGTPLAGLKTDRISQHVPNDPILCPICQSFLRIRDIVVGQPLIAATSAVRSWFIPATVMHVSHLALHASAPRAPPDLS